MATLEMKKISGTVSFVRRLLDQLEIPVYSKPGLEKHDLKVMCDWIMYNRGDDKESYYKKLSDAAPLWIPMRDTAALWRTLTCMQDISWNDTGALDVSEAINMNRKGRSLEKLHFEAVQVRGVVVEYHIRAFDHFLIFAQRPLLASSSKKLVVQEAAEGMVPMRVREGVYYRAGSRAYGA